MTSNQTDSIGEVPDDRLLDPPFRFQCPDAEHRRRCFQHVHAQAEEAYQGDGVWVERDGGKLAELPESSRPLHLIDGACPPLYRLTAWRLIGYAHAHQAEPNGLHLDRLLAGGEYLLREQQPDGSFLYWRGREDGWPGSRHLLFCNANVGCAFVELHRVTGEERYLDASRRVAEWAMAFETDDNDNYNSLAIWHLCEHYTVTGEKRLLDSAVEKTVDGVFPRQLPTGAWPGHNSWVFYHGIILRGFAALHRILPDGHRAKPELRRRMIMAANHIVASQRENGFLRSCSDEDEWRKSRAPGNAYSVHAEEKVCPFAVHALICVGEWTDLDVGNALCGLLSAPPQDELTQGQEGMMLLAYAAALRR